ncbi:MAG TPA: hypothetical protein DEQ43_24420 [Nocardioides bacterium]|nr:hypothetical protein [Nocardioides sp.]
MRAVEKISRAERKQRTTELLLEAHATDDRERREALLDEVILINRGVAEAVANRYRGRSVPVEDLHQAAYEGLVKAVHKFDPTVRPDLLTYAVPTIRGEVQRWFRDQSWMVRPPRRLQERQWKVSRSIAHLEQELGREPTDDELLRRRRMHARGTRRDHPVLRLLPAAVSGPAGRWRGPRPHARRLDPRRGHRGRRARGSDRARTRRTPPQRPRSPGHLYALLRGPHPG